MDTSKIIKAVVGHGRYTTTEPIMKEDHGIYLQIENLELPASYEVDFSNSRKGGDSVTVIGDENGVLIPTQFIRDGKDVFAFLYWVGPDYGRTVYTFCIPNHVRPDRTNEQPEPEQQSVIDQAISALNTAVAQTAQDVLDADASATSAAQSAESADQSAGQAAESAAGAKRDADFLRDASATATTLPEGSEATATLTDGQFTFGVPKGDTGDKGDKGDTGNSGVYIGTDEPTDENVGVWVDTDGSADTLAERVKVFYLEIIGYFEPTGNLQFRIIDDNNELHNCVTSGIPTMLCNANDPSNTKYYLYAGSYFDYVPYHVWASVPMTASGASSFNKLEIGFLASYDFKTISRSTTVKVDATVVQ